MEKPDKQEQTQITAVQRTAVIIYIDKTHFTLFFLIFLFRHRRYPLENLSNLCRKLPVLDIKNIMLLCAVIRHTALSTRHKFFDFGELFNIYRIVADEQNRLIIDINHIFAEHLFIPHVFDADKLFTDKFYGNTA